MPEKITDQGALRQALFALLNLSPDRPVAAPKGGERSRLAIPGGTRIDLEIDGAPATLLHPGGCPPAILYCHAHGGDYSLGRRELTEGAWWLSAPFGDTLLRRGYAVLCMDMPGFGDRQAEGSEAVLAKAGFWHGRPLFGQMIEGQRRAVDWLVASGLVDAGRIAAMGVSMGAAHSFWLGALDDRIGAVAQFCMLADLAPMIATGSHDHHGFYLCVPGLLSLCEMGDVAALVAPRPQFVAHGAQDALAPSAARSAACDRLLRAYGQSDALTLMIDPEAGHAETPLMRRAALQFLARWSGLGDQAE